MSYKIKSLVYFICFLIAATVYYVTDSYAEVESSSQSMELAKANVQEVQNGTPAEQLDFKTN